MDRAKEKSVPRRLVLFDLDGVLVDSRAPITRSLNHALAAVGLEEQPRQALERFIGNPLIDVFRELLVSQGAGESLAVSCVEHYRDCYRDASLSETTLFPGIEQVVVQLAERTTLGVATSKPPEFAEPILEALGLREPFAAVVGPSLAPEVESKRKTVERALHSLGFAQSASESVMVGDRHHDVSAGRALGLTTVGVTWGIGSRKELESHGVEHLVNSPPELLELLKRI